MKNVKCQKLLIDCSKSKSVGTLKDISLVGSFKFPKAGDYADGLEARSHARTGKQICKTAQQLKSLSKRSQPIAGATGAKVVEDMWCPIDTSIQLHSSQPNAEPYSVMFLQSAKEKPAVTELQSTTAGEVQQPEVGYDLKK